MEAAPGHPGPVAGASARPVEAGGVGPAADPLHAWSTRATFPPTVSDAVPRASTCCVATSPNVGASVVIFGMTLSAAPVTVSAAGPLVSAPYRLVTTAK